MPSKPTKAKGPEQSGPKAPNKQRVPLINRGEKRAADTGGALDERIPEDQLRQRLRDEGTIQFDADQLIPLIANRVGWARLMAVNEAARLEPQAVVQQALDTAGIALELLQRLQHMHPDIAAVADAILMRRDDYLLKFRRRVEPDLILLSVVLRHSAETMAAWPSKRGPKRTERDEAKGLIAQALCEHSRPRIAAKSAIALADELLQICGVKSTRKQGKR